VEKIAITNDVISYLDKLIFTLYEKDYFSYLENAEQYVSNIYNFIGETIPINNHKKSPKTLLKYGDFYIFYKPNNRTTWYIFFNKKDSKYLIKHITNNHKFDASFINELHSNE